MCCGAVSDETAAGPAPDSAAPRQPRAVTLRALLIGLAGVAFIALYSDFNNQVVKPGPPVVGNHLPIGPLCLVLLVAAAWNPLAGRLWRRPRLGGRGLGGALILIVVAALNPGFGFFRSFEIQLIRPWL